MKLVILLVISLNNSGGIQDSYLVSDIKRGCPDMQQLEEKAVELALSKHSMNAVVMSECVSLRAEEYNF
jgi:hypothetical protein